MTIPVEQLRALLAAVPAGRWTTYGELARACGGTDHHARTLNQRLRRAGLPGAHRVLRASGTIAPTALGDPAAVRRRLEAEGVSFTDHRADPAAHIHVCELFAPR